MELAERAAALRRTDIIWSEHVLYAVAVDFPEYWRKIGIQPEDIIRYGNKFTGSHIVPPTPSRLVMTTNQQAQDLARAEGAEVVTIGHWLTVYLNDHDRRVGPFNDAPFDPIRIKRTLSKRKPFSDEPKTTAEELLREALGEVYGKTPRPKTEDPSEN